ncbi:UNKNOWN [Stylonychia lemnae]|uniref:Uncharacterized protein n=1 Tax=Stylonychia lemnae TaxID=5949 RepID=A0A077ZUX5_STYLE|nr:UNKNOWN [Stylonychia lemnae]|eukprot:CDW73694.1 UNKNOWN [Stylonychia lemnae]
MDYQSVQQLNAFRNMTEDESVSSTSNMSGTFNKQNNPLKINQRKQKKASYQPSEKGEMSQSENESLNSFSQDKKQPSNLQIKESNIDIKSSGSSSKNNQQKVPPPPPLMQSLTRAFQKLAAKHGPPPMVTSGNNGSVGAPLSSNLSEKQKLPPTHSKQSSSQIQNKYNKSAGILSPPVKDYNNKDIIKEESQESNSILRKTDLDNSISQDQAFMQNEDDIYVIKINIKNHSNIPQNVKIPNPNYNILEQAKYLLMYDIQNNPDKETQLSEDLLSRTIKQIHQILMKQKEHEYERQLGDYNKQVLNLQAKLQLQQSANNPRASPQNPFKKQATGSEYSGLAGLVGLGMSQKLNLNDSTQLIEAQNNQEDIKKMKEENQELRMRANYLEQDLAFLSQKTKELQTKYETEIENLRSQLKGSQSEQFVKQQIEHKKLIEDNSVLMREVKLLQDQLSEEQQKVIELFEDAQMVKEEIMREMSDYEKTKRELEKMKILNKNLRKRLNEDSIEQSELDHSDEERYDDYARTLNDLDGKMKKKKKVEKVSVGLSRPESLMSLANGFNQKLEELIEEKSKSIINVLAQSSLTNYINTQHPYAINYQYPTGGHSHMNQAIQPPRRPTYQKMNGQIVEISMYESENGVYNNNTDSKSQLENHVSSDSSLHHQRILKSNSSDIQVLKHKIKEVRDKHNSQLQSTSSFLKLNNASFENLNNPQMNNHLSRQQITASNNKVSQHSLNNNRLDTDYQQPETYKAFNVGLIQQENQPLKTINERGYNKSSNNQIQFYDDQDNENSEYDEQEYDQQESQFQQIEQNQFKTPVWTQQQRQQDIRNNQIKEQNYQDNNDSYYGGSIHQQQQQEKFELNQQSFLNNSNIQKDKLSFNEDQQMSDRNKKGKLPYSP